MYVVYTGVCRCHRVRVDTLCPFLIRRLAVGGRSSFLDGSRPRGWVGTYVIRMWFARENGPS